MFKAMNDTLICFNNSEYMVWKSDWVLGNETLLNETARQLNSTSGIVFQAMKAFMPIMTNPTIPLFYKILILAGVSAGIGVFLNLAYRGFQFLILTSAYIYTIIKEIVIKIRQSTNKQN